MNIDRQEADDFLIDRLIKDPEDARLVLNIIQENFDLIKIYYKHLQCGSDKFP